MKTEIEAKFLGVEPEAMREKLRAIGAALEQPERLMRRRQFDFDDMRLDKRGAWLRLRDEGDRVTLTLKQWHEHSLEGTQEISLEVSDFGVAEELLTTAGLTEKSYQETRRETWKLGRVEIMIDTWPWVPTFLEIEAPTREEVADTAAKLGLSLDRALYGGVFGVYRTYYDVSREEIDRCPAITFAPVPQWLEAKRKT